MRRGSDVEETHGGAGSSGAGDVDLSPLWGQNGAQRLRCTALCLRGRGPPARRPRFASAPLATPSPMRPRSGAHARRGQSGFLRGQEEAPWRRTGTLRPGARRSRSLLVLPCNLRSPRGGRGDEILPVGFRRDPTKRCAQHEGPVAQGPAVNARGSASASPGSLPPAVLASAGLCGLDPAVSCSCRSGSGLFAAKACWVLQLTRLGRLAGEAVPRVAGPGGSWPPDQHLYPEPKGRMTPPLPGLAQPSAVWAPGRPAVFIVLRDPAALGPPCHHVSLS